MAQKSDKDVNDWKHWYDQLYRQKVEELSMKLSASVLNNSNATGLGSDRLWQELRAAQDMNMRGLSTEMELLRKEVADARQQNSSLYSTVMSMQRENTQLRQDIRDLQEQFQKYHFDSTVTALQIQVTKLEHKIKSLKTDVRQAQALQTKTPTMQIDVAKLEQEVKTLKSIVSEARGVHKKTSLLQNDVAKLGQEISSLHRENKMLDLEIHKSYTKAGSKPSTSLEVNRLEAKIIDSSAASCPNVHAHAESDTDNSTNMTQTDICNHVV